MRTELVELAGRQHGAFSRRQASRWYRTSEIRRELHTGRWHRVCRGVFCDRSRAENTRTRLAAIQLAFGAPVVACLHTAAELHGFGIVATGRVHVVDPGRHLHGYPWLVVHQLDVPMGDLVMVDDIVATAPARTAVELARTQGRPRTLAVLDAALRSGEISTADLAAEVERQAKRRGIVQVRELLPSADPRAESPMESVLRLCCLDARLPAPEPQFEVGDAATGRWYRLDLAWPARKVALEYDGVEFHTGAEAMRRDRSRHNWLVERGWTVVYATADDVLRRPAHLIRQLSRALTHVDHERNADDCDHLSAFRS